MTDDELNRRGWFAWYSKNYWINNNIHPHGVDPTHHGYTREEVVQYELAKDAKK